MGGVCKVCFSAESRRRRRRRGRSGDIIMEKCCLGIVEVDGGKMCVCACPPSSSFPSTIDHTRLKRRVGARTKRREFSYCTKIVEGVVVGGAVGLFCVSSSCVIVPSMVVRSMGRSVGRYVGRYVGRSVGR